MTDPTSGFRCLGPAAWRRFAESYPEDYPEPESLFWCARNGLRVGEVATISLLPEDPRRVVAIIEVDPMTPMRSDTRARLEY